MSADVTKDLLEALKIVAQMAENLKKPCGTDPESPQAIRNAQYMNISYAARAAIARAEASLEPGRQTMAELEGQTDNLLSACHRLALELECLLLDTKDSASVSRWWDSAMAALDEWHKVKDSVSARPVPAEPVNARLLEALKRAKDSLVAFKFVPGDANRWEESDEENLAAVNSAIAESQQERLLQDMHDAGREIDRVMAEAAPEAVRLTDYSSTVDRAWARFCGAFGDGPDAPYPGMIAAFETHYGQSFRDKEWRTEAACWAAAWSKATELATKTNPQAKEIDDEY